MTRPPTRVEIYDILKQRRLARESTLGSRVEQDGFTVRKTEDGSVRICEP